MARGHRDEHFLAVGELSHYKDNYGNGQRVIQGAVRMPRMQALTHLRVWKKLEKLGNLHLI